MDLQPRRRTQNMARWSLAGSIGMTAGPLAIGAASAIGFGWRGLYVLMGALTAALVVVAWRSPIRGPSARRGGSGTVRSFLSGLRGALKALRRGSVLRWLALLEAADLMLDVLFGFVALYFVDVARIPAGQAAAAVVAWTASGLVGEFLVIPLLERVPGLLYLRVSAAAAALIFPAFLLVGPPGVKVVLLVALGLVKAGWYSVLQARLYDSMPGKGGTAMAVGNIAGLLGSLIPLFLGAVAQAAGLRTAMWLLLAAPLSLLMGLPWERKVHRGRRVARRQARV
jgi:FSR family fosmidomycin resistance protein-like MFS transporter